MVISNHSEETLTQTVVKEAIDEVSTLVLYNDDVHTFDYVIETLVRVCEHTYEQAEQCAIIVHYKGKCDVKSGSYDYLRPLCEALLEAGLTAMIEG
jgi:ATP-dependent clp protease adaptor protein clpS